MASSNGDFKTEIATLQHEILSYKPGKAVPCDDERVVFPDKLVIGMIDLCGYTYNIDDLRSVLHGDEESSKLSDKRQTSTEDQGEYLTDHIFVIDQKYDGEWGKYLQDLAGKVGCMLLLVRPSDIQYIKKWITAIKEVTGRALLCALFPGRGIYHSINELKQLGITDIYEVVWPNCINSDEEQFHWLDLLHGCLQEGDRALAANELKKICTNPMCKSLNEKTKKEARREVERLQAEKEDERARAEKEKHSLATEMTRKLESKQQRVDTLINIVQEKERNETTLKQQVEELKQAREGDRARGEKEKRSLATEMTRKLESKQQRVATLTNIVQEKERNETILRQQVEELKQAREGDRARGEKEKRTMATEMTKRLESKQQRVDALTDIVVEKGRNETTLKQHVEALKKELESKEQQLERVNWKLRTKIQLESEIRLAEQKVVTSGKQAQGGTSSSDGNLTGGLGSRDTLQAGEEPPDDEFADILKKIADDLYDEAKIDSLAGQLGILQGDIQRAHMTNVKFNRVTSDGTRHMLKQWRRGVSREEERMELSKALQAANLVNIADLYLSKGDVTYKNQEDLTDGSKSQHPDQSPERRKRTWMLLT